MKKIGLVFAGGGGKGAYQIGVWKALREFNIERNITVVSGTSVGALNASLFLQGDIAIGEKVWTTISPDKILSLKGADLLNNLNGLGFKIEEKRLYRYTKALENFGVFSRSGLLSIIENYLDVEKLSQLNHSCYATCYEIGKNQPTYFKMNGCYKDKIISILLATSAIPLCFPAEIIDGKSYIDGGIPRVGDNIPIKPVYDEGCNIIIVVALNRDDLIDESLYPNAKLIQIIPQNHQGGFLNGTLKFTSSNASLRIKQGYEDACSILTPIYEMTKTDYKFRKTVVEVVHSHKAFSEDHEKNNIRINQKKIELLRKLQEER